MSDLTPLLQQLRPISLEELLAVAALLERTDRKYVVDAAQLESFIHALGSEVEVLEIENRRQAAYASLYFDTAERDSLRSAAQGRRRRFKVRTRTYLDSSSSFIEVKLRSARGRTVKVREAIPFADRDTISPAALPFVEQAFAEHGISAEVAGRLRPALHVVFRRTTLFVPSAACRITVDTDISVAGPGVDAIAWPDAILLETKSAKGQAVVDRHLWRLGARPQTVSKFAIGSLLLDRGLPGNKWHRTMDRHLHLPVA